MLLQGDEYNLKELNGRIVLFGGNSTIYPEEYVEIDKQNTNDKFIVAEVHRDIKQIKKETEKREEAAIYAVIIYKRLSDNIINRMRARDIRECLNHGEEEKALNCIVDCFDNSIYSIDYEDRMKISLIYAGDKADVKFGGEYLAENVTLSRGYVVFYNYCEKLQYISSFYNEIQEKLNFDMSREQVLRLYILGRYVKEPNDNGSICENDKNV